MGHLPFHLANCHGFIAFILASCHGFIAVSFGFIAMGSFPNPFAFWRPICRLAPQTHFPFGTPHFLGQPKGISSREVKFVLWRAYQQFVKWHPIFPRGRMWLDPRQHFVWPLKKDGSSSFLKCHMEDSFGDSRQFSEFWSEKPKFWQRSSHFWASLIPDLSALLA